MTLPEIMLYDELIKEVGTVDTEKLVKKQIVIIRPVVLKIKYQILLA